MWLRSVKKNLSQRREYLHRCRMRRKGCWRLAELLVDGGGKGRVEIALAAVGNLQETADQLYPRKKTATTQLRFGLGGSRFWKTSRGFLEMCRLQNWQTPHLIQPPARPRVSHLGACQWV